MLHKGVYRPHLPSSVRMAIFKKSDLKSEKPRDRGPQPSRTAAADAAISIIGFGMTVVGDILTDGVVRVEGEVRGTIRAGKALVLGQAGVIEGDVFTEDAVIGGRVKGSIVAANRLDLQGTSIVEGEIWTPAEHLKVEEGARFTGQVHIIEQEDPNASTTLDPHVAHARLSESSSPGHPRSNVGASGPVSREDPGPDNAQKGAEQAAQLHLDDRQRAEMQR